MKKIIILLLLVLVACGKEAVELEVSIKDMSGYNLVESESFLEIDEENFYKLVDANRDALIYLSNEHCPTCQKATPLLAETLEEQEYYVYYLDSYKIEDQKRLIDYLKDDLLMNENGKYSLRTPHLFYIKNGKLKESIIGYHDNIQDYYLKLIEKAK